MRGCFYMMVIAYRVMIKGKDNNKLARQYQSQIHLLEQYWDGIGEWKSQSKNRSIVNNYHQSL